MFLGIILLVMHGQLVQGQVLGAAPSMAECQADVAKVLADNAAQTKTYQDGGETVESFCVDASGAKAAAAVSASAIQQAGPKQSI